MKHRGGGSYRVFQAHDLDVCHLTHGLMKKMTKLASVPQHLNKKVSVEKSVFHHKGSKNYFSKIAEGFYKSFLTL